MDYPALEQLIRAYFHPDWSVDGSIWGVVDLFTVGEPDLAPLLPAEIEQCLEEIPTEAALKAYIIDTLGGYYLADSRGGTFRGWLTQIADRVRAATAGGA